MKKDFGLSLKEYRLQGLVDGEVTVLYHGTTRSFTTFDISKTRKDLVDQFYGSGIYLTPSKWVAIRYAHANRNIGFDPEDIIPDMKRVNSRAGAFLEDLTKYGVDAWDMYFDKVRGQGPEYPGPALEEYLGVDPNTVGDLASYIIGSHIKPMEDTGTNFFFSPSTGNPEWLYNSLDELGLDSGKYRPKVYTVAVRVQNPLVTASTSEARKAKSRGFDSVVFFGPHTIDGIPEVAVFSPKDTKVLKFEVL